MKYTIKEIKEKTLKPLNGIVQVLITDRISPYFVWFLANYTKITPNQISWLGILFIFITGYIFYQGNFVLGGIFFFVTFFMDTIDGKLARIKNMGTKVGLLIEGTSDKLRVFVPLLGLSLGYYKLTNDYTIFPIALTALFANLLFDFTGLFMLLKTKLVEENPNIKIEGEAKTNKTTKTGKIGKLRSWLNKHRLELQICGTEQEHLMMTLFPIISFIDIKLVKYGLIIGTVMILAWISLKDFIFWKRNRYVKYLKKHT